MKQIFGLFLLLGLLSGCVHNTIAPQYVKTVSSDLYPVEMSRDQYYEETGLAYSKDLQSEKAIDQYRLSLLHNPSRVSARLSLATEYKKTGKNHLALFELDQVLKTQPQNSAALLQMGELYLSAKIYSKAKQIFMSILTSAEEFEKTRWALFYISKLENDDTAAEEYLNQISVTELNQDQLFFEKAVLAQKAGRSAEYVDLVMRAYVLKPHVKKYALEMKNVYFQRGDFDSAQTVLKHYADVHDFDEDVSNNLVETAVKTMHYEMALQLLNQKKLNGADTNEVDLKKAHIYFLASDLDKAEKTYLSVLSQNPDNDEAHFFVAQIYLSRNDASAAEAQLSLISVASPYFASAQVRLARFELRKGRSEQAFKRFRDAQNQRPDQLAVYTGHVGALIQAHQYISATEVAEAGLVFFPKNEDLQLQAAVGYAGLGNERAFKKHIDEALKINPDNAEVYAALAEMWFRKNANPQEIEAMANKALANKTQSQNVKPLLAWALMAQDRSVAAISMFEKFYEENPTQPFYAEALAQIYRNADIVVKAHQMNQQAAELRTQQKRQPGLTLDRSRQPAGKTARPDLPFPLSQPANSN